MSDDQVDTFNHYRVGRQGERVVILHFHAAISKSEALNLAAWLVTVVGDDEEFARVLQAVQNT